MKFRFAYGNSQLAGNTEIWDPLDDYLVVQKITVRP